MQKLLSTIFLAIGILALAFPFYAYADTSVSTTLSASSLQVGSTVDVSVFANVQSGTTAAKIYINFDGTKLSGESIDVSDSGFVTTWPEAIFDNSAGQVRLQAGQAAPGLSGEIKMATLRFSAKASGDVSMSLDPSSLILDLNDQNQLSSFGRLATIAVSDSPSSTGSGGSSGGSSSSSGGGGGGGGGGTSVSSGGGCAKRGDIDCNGQVNITDLSRLLSSWRKNNAAADFNRNGLVDIVDLSILLSSWKK